MGVSLLYHVSQAVIRVALAVYFRKLEISGASRVPARGPLILAANHPHSVLDALILGLAAGRMLHYLAHSGMFRNRWKAWFLHHTGVIPVYRPQDVDDASDKNVDMFSACHRLMERGGAIGIFPEGTSEEEQRVKKLKTGAARIALQSEERCGWTLGVTIVPVGLNFESRRRFRSRVLLTFGKPMTAADYREAYEAEPVETVNRLTGALQEAIRRLVVDIGRSEFTELVRDVEVVYKGELLAREGLAIPGRSKFKRDQWVSREIPRALEYFFQHSPDVVWRVGKLLKDYRRRLERFRLRDEMLRRERGPSLRGETVRFVALGLFGLPVAAYGALWNVLPYKATDRLAARAAADTTKVHFFQLTLGALIYSLYYAPLLYTAYRLLGPVAASIFTATLPPSGLFARGYARHMVRRREMLRFAYLELTHGYYVQTLRQRRQRLIDEMDAALEEYLAARAGESPSPAAREAGRTR